VHYRQRANQQEDQGGNRCRQTKVLTAAAFKGDAIGVAHKQVGIAGWRGGTETIRATVGQQLNQHEVVKVEGKAGNHQRSQRFDEQRQRNFKEVLERTRAIHCRGFIQVVRDSFQQAHAQDHHVRITQPGVDDDNHRTGGGRVAEPGRFDAEQRAQHHVDFTEALVKQPFENQN
ncbi:hypothetical protein COLO4_00847, partial [Corchorus olitorius]